MEFRNKVILIVTPNKWGKLHLSKHHYAICLAEKRNTVYFLNPPDKEQKEKIQINNISPNLFEINYKTFFPYKLRFHFRFLYNFLMKVQINRILKMINKELDVVWCFDFNLFADLHYFKAKLKIYHPVDPVVFPSQIKPAESADIVFSVSEKILSNFKLLKTPSFFINHGIDEQFKNYALEKLKNLSNTIPSKIKVGYFGNLLRPIINKEVLFKIINENQDIEFSFWGPYSIENNNLAGSKNDGNEFAKILMSIPNVKLLGIKTKDELIKEIQRIDVFLLIYKEEAASSDRSNSHKIMEYLSTGKVIVSNLFSTYQSFQDLIVMPQSDNDDEIPALFHKVISNLEYYNSPELQRKRIEYALDNTYEKQIQRIEKIINENYHKNT